MNRPALAAALVLVAIVAAVSLVRCGGTESSSEPLSRAEVPSTTPAPSAVDLAEPEATSAPTARVDVAPVAESAAQIAPAPVRTGVRVLITAIEDGRPLVGVRVRAISGDPRAAWEPVDSARGTEREIVRTGADGVVEIELTPRTIYTLEAHSTDGSNAHGLTKVEPPIALGEVREIDLQFRTQLGASMHGRVIDRGNRQPIVGARVGRETNWGMIAAEDEQRTDADGRFHVEGSTWRTGMLFVIADGYELAGFRVADGHDAPDRAFEIGLSRAASVRATVKDARGTPMPGVDVVLTASKHDFAQPTGISPILTGWTGTTSWRAQTDASGTVTIAGLPTRIPLETSLWRGSEEILRPEYLIKLGPGEAFRIEWQVGQGAALHGIAREQDGSPAAGLAIVLERASAPRSIYFSRSGSKNRSRASCDAEGHFVFHDVSPGDWWLGPDPSNRQSEATFAPHDPAPIGQHVVVPPGVPRVDVELRVHRGLAIAGRVLDPLGQPVRQATIYFRSSDGTRGGERSRDDGSFRIGPLHPSDFELSAKAHARFADSDAVSARPGDDDVVLQLRAGGSLRGVVVDGVTGKPTKAQVVIRARVSSDGLTAMPSLDPQGTFEIAGLEPGLFDVWASTPSGTVGSAHGVDVLSGARSDVRIELVPGARVQVRYRGEGPGAEVFALSDGAIVGTGSLSKDGDVTLPVPAGKIVVRLRERGASVDHDAQLELAAGAQCELVFDGTWR